MPSQKRRITVYPDEEILLKAEHIAREQNRSISNFVQFLLIREIHKYELENGKISLYDRFPPT